MGPVPRPRPAPAPAGLRGGQRERTQAARDRLTAGMGSRDPAPEPPFHSPSPIPYSPSPTPPTAANSTGPFADSSGGSARYLTPRKPASVSQLRICSSEKPCQT